MSVIATRPFGGVAVLSLLFCLVACMAQDTQTTTDSQPGQNGVKTEVRSGEVLYVSGNDVAKAKAPPAEVATAELTPRKLAKAAMSMPLVGLAGFLALAAFAAFRIVRKRQPRLPIDSQDWIRL
jgi:hypothetical protein